MKRLMMMLGLLLCCVGVAFGEIVITRQPETQTVRAGGKATFTVKATGAAKQAVTWYFTDPATGKRHYLREDPPDTGRMAVGWYYHLKDRCWYFFDPADGGAAVEPLLERRPQPAEGAEERHGTSP